MKHPIYPCLWFDGTAAAAATAYIKIFAQSRILNTTPLTTTFELNGKKILALNGGPQFAINPSISLFVTCPDRAETERVWNALIETGSALMPLGKYDWSEQYGWVADRFGLTWQITEDATASATTIRPCLLFTARHFGKAHEAMAFYTALFVPSSIGMEALFPDDSPHAGNLMYAEFELGHEPFIAMDGPDTPDYTFNEGVSLVVECDTQEEIDLYWSALTHDGEESRCGWLKDKFGVSWQIVPARIGQLLHDPQRGPRAMQALLQMKKIDIQKLEEA